VAPDVSGLQKCAGEWLYMYVGGVGLLKFAATTKKNRTDKRAEDGYTCLKEDQEGREK